MGITHNEVQKMTLPMQQLSWHVSGKRSLLLFIEGLAWWIATLGKTTVRNCTSKHLMYVIVVDGRKGTLGQLIIRAWLHRRSPHKYSVMVV